MKKNKIDGTQVGTNGSVGDNAEASVDVASAYVAKVTELEARLAEMTADLQRTRADFENYRKQVDLQRENARKMAQQSTVIKMLPLLDDLERAITAYVELAPLGKSMEKTLGGLGIKKISSDAGVEFNPDLHDAVMVEGDGAKEIVSETLRPGYYYESEVLRPAMVKVKKI